jgi:hypothetical protein
MMNKQKPHKAWNWKVAIFLPLLALLLMAFGRKAESGPSVGSGFSSFGKVISPDSTKQWSEADFLTVKDFIQLINKRKSLHWLEPKITIRNQDGKMDTIIDPYNRSRTFYECNIQIDSKSIIWVNNHKEQLKLKELHEYVRTFFDYQFSNRETMKGYFPIKINGLEKMMPQCIFFIVNDIMTPQTDYQRLLNNIGNTILEIRGKYALEIYQVDYVKLSSEQKELIDLMIPLSARFIKTPQFREEPKIAKDSLSARSENSEYIEVVHADKLEMNNDNPCMMYLYNVQLKLREGKLSAGYIEVNKDSSLIYAKGRPDSTGTIVGEPIFIFGDGEITASEIRYNYKTKKGIIYNKGESKEF